MKTIKRICTQLSFAFVVFTYLGSQAAALSVPSHLVDVQWPTSSPDGYSDVSIDITVENLVGTAGVYYANTIYLNGTNTDNAEPNIMYGGFQNVGYTGSAWIGKMAIFSVWGVWTGYAEPGGWGTSFGGEGNGYSVRIPYEWQVGTTYTFSIRIIGQDGSNNVYAAYLKDNFTGVETRIGRVLVTIVRGKMYSPVSFHEIYGFNNTSPSQCSDLVTTQATFTNSRADGQLLSGSAYYVNPYAECPGRNKSHDIAGGVRTTFGDTLSIATPQLVTAPETPQTPVVTQQLAPSTPADLSVTKPVVPSSIVLNTEPPAATKVVQKDTVPKVKNPAKSSKKSIVIGLGAVFALELVVGLSMFVYRKR